MMFFALNGKRSEMPIPRVFGREFEPAKLMFGIRFCGFADGKNCGRLFSTTARVFWSRVSCDIQPTDCCAQFTPAVNSATVVGEIVCSQVLTQLTVLISY